MHSTSSELLKTFHFSGDFVTFEKQNLSVRARCIAVKKQKSFPKKSLLDKSQKATRK